MGALQVSLLLAYKARRAFDESEEAFAPGEFLELAFWTHLPDFSYPRRLHPLGANAARIVTIA
jgi:hypothetical protein